MESDEIDQGASAPVGNEPPTQPVTDLDTFVKLLTSWHSKRVLRLENLMATPEGTKVTLDDKEAFVLTGETLKAFQFGVAMSLTQLGTLPFEAEFEEPTPDAKPH